MSVTALLIVCGHLLSAQQQADVRRIGYSLHRAPAAEVAEQLRKILSGYSLQAEIDIDKASNRVLVTGPGEAQRIAAELVAALDRVAAQPATSSSRAGRPIVRAYQVGKGRLQPLASDLQRQYPPKSGVRVLADSRTGQLLVVAPPDKQQAIARQIGPSSVARPPVESDAATPQRLPESPDPIPSQLRLRYISSQELEAGLRDFLGGRLSVRSSGDGELATITLPGKNGQRVDLRVDRSTGTVTVSRPSRLATAWLEVVAALDHRSSTPQQLTKLVSLQYAKRASVKRALSYLEEAPAEDGNHVIEVTRLGAAGRGSRPGGGVMAVLAQNQDRNGTAAQSEAVNEIQPGGAPEQAGAAPAGAAAAVAGGFIGQVQIEYLEGSDVIVIRGHQRDVQRVMEIIQKIEELSAETEPEITIVPLAHVDSRALADMVTDLYTEVYEIRQGSVSITPLVKPNALLLIGRMESVNVVVKLIQRLDQPVAPETQFHVFQLEHISASEALATIQGFFDNAAQPNEETDRGGLGTKVRVTADVRSNSLIVQASARDLAEVQRLIKQIDVTTSRVVNRVQVFQLRNSQAEDLAPVLQGAISGQTTGGTGGGQGPLPGQVIPTDPGGAGGRTQQAAQGRSTMLTFEDGERVLTSGIMRDVQISADPATNSLIVTGPEEAMGLIAALILRLDQLPSTEAQIKVFTLRNGEASALRDTLEELFDTTADDGGQAAFQAAGSETSLVPLRFTVDQRTNSIIVSGTAADLIVVQAIILRLDGSDARQRKNLVYRLRYTTADDVALAIQNFLQAEQQRTQQQIQQFTQGDPVVLSPFEQIEREVVVVAEALSNTLIISATPRFYDEIVEIVREIDSIPPMVMIQVMVAQVMYTETDQFGVELGIQDSLLFDRGVVLGNPGLINQGNVTSGDHVGGQGLTDLSLGRQATELGFGGIVFSAGSESVNVLIRALRQRARVDLLARPQIMTLDGQAARVQVGEDVRIVSGTTITDNGLTNLTTEPRSIGLILDILPRISSDGMVTMLVSVERSRLGDESDGTPIGFDQFGNVIRSPKVELTTALTTISVRSGQTAVFSGLITRDDSIVSRGVPWLSDLPIIGNAFRFDSAVTEEEELLIILTPHVVRNSDDIERIKAIESARMSWCLADVIQIHGDLRIVGDQSGWNGTDIMTIFPDGEPVQADPLSAPGQLKSTRSQLPASLGRGFFSFFRRRGTKEEPVKPQAQEPSEQIVSVERLPEGGLTDSAVVPLVHELPQAADNPVMPTAFQRESHSPAFVPADSPQRLPETY